MAGLRVRSVLLRPAVSIRLLGQCLSAHSAPASPHVRACALHLLCWDAG